MRNLPWPILLLCASCGPGADGDAGQAIVNSQTESGGNSVAAQLDRAALRSGALLDAGALSPVGLYRHSHEVGQDVMCVVPARKAGHFRFGMEAAFGKDVSCSGRGTARQVDDKLILNFARSSCIIVASYQGDRIVLPGALDVSCDDMCSDRGSFAGVSYPRLAATGGSALRARDLDGKALCPPD